MARPTKRRTKHRGNAAGIVEARGKTHKGASTGGGRGARGKVDPRLKEPTWRAAFIRALVAAAIFVVVMFLLNRTQAPAVTVLVGVLLLAVYTPFGFYTDRFFYRRRIAKAERERAERRASKG